MKLYLVEDGRAIETVVSERSHGIGFSEKDRLKYEHFRSDYDTVNVAWEDLVAALVDPIKGSLLGYATQDGRAISVRRRGGFPEPVPTLVFESVFDPSYTVDVARLLARGIQPHRDFVQSLDLMRPSVHRFMAPGGPAGFTSRDRSFEELKDALKRLDDRLRQVMSRPAITIAGQPALPAPTSSSEFNVDEVAKETNDELVGLIAEMRALTAFYQENTPNV